MPFSETAPTVAHSRKLIQDVVDDHIGGGGGTTTDVENFLATEALISVGGDMSVTGSTSLGQGQQVMTTGAQVFSGDKNFTGDVIIGDTINPNANPTNLTIVHKDSGGHITTGERIGGINLAGIDGSASPEMRTGVQIYGEGTGPWVATPSNPTKLVFVCENSANVINTSPCFEVSDESVTSQRDFTVNGITNLNGSVFQNGTQVDLVNPVDWSAANTFGGDLTVNSDLWVKGTVLIGDGGTTTENTSVEAHMIRYLGPHPIASLLPGSTSGLAIVGPENQHVVVQIRANGDEDSFAVVSNLTGSTNDPKAPDGTVFRVQRNGDTFFGVNEEVTYTQATGTLDVPVLSIGGSPITVTAQQLNQAGNNAFDYTADHLFTGSLTSTGDLNLLSTWSINGVDVTATAAEINKLDGMITSKVSLNQLSGLADSYGIPKFPTGIAVNNEIRRGTKVLTQNHNYQIDGSRYDTFICDVTSNDVTITVKYLGVGHTGTEFTVVKALGGGTVKVKMDSVGGSVELDRGSNAEYFWSGWECNRFVLWHDNGIDRWTRVRFS